MSYELGSGGRTEEEKARDRAKVAPAPREFFSCQDHLRLVDACRLTLLASWREDGRCDAEVVQAAIKTLELLERRLVAGR